MRLRRVEPVLRAALTGPCRIRRGGTVLVAISGGADSTALLVALASLASSLRSTVVAAHLDHGLRGDESTLDHAHVRALCRRLGVRLVATRIDAAARLRARGWNGEAGLRRLRRAFLMRAARHVGADVIATAHTADDQLETLLMRLARGTGLTGLGGMRPRQGRWIKPLLALSRAAARRDLLAAGIAWREDSSNATRAHLRNRLRLDVIPAWHAALEPDGDAAQRQARGETLALAAERAAAQLREARQALAREGAATLLRCRVSGAELALDAAALAAHPRAVQRFALLRLWRLAGVAERLTENHMAALLRLVRAPSPEAEVRLPLGVRAQCRAGCLTLLPVGPDPRPASAKARRESVKAHD